MQPFHLLGGMPKQEMVIERFGGVDYSTHPTKTEIGSSPDACNMIAEETDFLVKRPGYKRLAVTEDPVYGIFALPGETQDAIVHAGSTLYYMDAAGSLAALTDDMEPQFSFAFVMQAAVYLLDGQCYRKVYREGESWKVKAAAEEAYVPTTTMAAAPAGGGTALEAVNLLTGKRINTFIGDGSATKFTLDAQEIDADSVTVTVGGSPVSTAAVDLAAGTVTLSAAPPDGKGAANTVIAFSKTIPANADKINHCRFAGLYGGKNDTRVFLSGNPQDANCDWQSGLYDPAYFPDTGYTRIGSDAAPIVGYVRQFESQLVIKAGGNQEATQYLRTFLIDDQGTAAYPLKQGAQGAGAVAFRSFGSLGDIPMFLSQDGVQGVFGTALTEQRSIQRLSRSVDPKLTLEPALHDACAVVWRDRYYLALAGKCYVADGRSRRADGAPEWYFWDQFPASCFAIVDNTLCFGTEDGRILRLCDPAEKDAFLDDGQPICAWWCTPDLPLADWTRRKTIREIVPVLVPYSRSGVRVSYESGGSTIQTLDRNLDLFSFLTLDFSRFALRCHASAIPIRIRRKLHRAQTIRVRLQNDRPREPFGLLALAIRFTATGREM